MTTSNRDSPPSRQTAVPPRHGIHCLLAQRLVEIKFSKELFVEPPTTIETYLKSFANELGDRILDSFPPLQGAQDPTSPLLAKLLRRPYAAQAIAVGGIVKRLAEGPLGRGRRGVWYRQDFDFSRQLVRRYGRKEVYRSRHGPEPLNPEVA